MRERHRHAVLDRHSIAGPLHGAQAGDDLQRLRIGHAEQRRHGKADQQVAGIRAIVDRLQLATEHEIGRESHPRTVEDQVERAAPGAFTKIAGEGAGIRADRTMRPFIGIVQLHHRHTEPRPRVRESRRDLLPAVLVRRVGDPGVPPNDIAPASREPDRRSARIGRAHHRQPPGRTNGRPRRVALGARGRVDRCISQRAQWIGDAVGVGNRERHHARRVANDHMVPVRTQFNGRESPAVGRDVGSIECGLRGPDTAVSAGAHVAAIHHRPSLVIAHEEQRGVTRLPDRRRDDRQWGDDASRREPLLLPPDQVHHDHRRSATAIPPYRRQTLPVTREPWLRPGAVERSKRQVLGLPLGLRIEQDEARSTRIGTHRHHASARHMCVGRREPFAMRDAPAIPGAAAKEVGMQ